MSAVAWAGTAALLWLGPALSAPARSEDAALSALVLVALAVATAATNARSFTAEAIVFGSCGALAFAWLGGTLQAVGAGTAALVAAVHLPRTIRGGSREARAGLLLLSAGAGFAALIFRGLLPETLSGDWMAFAAVLIGTAVLLALPYAIGVDDPIATFLRQRASRERGAHRSRLGRAVVLRRRLMATANELDAELLRPFESAFRGVAELARARSEARPEAARFIDGRLELRLRRIRDALRAASTRAALLRSVEQAHTETLESEGEALRAECEALLQLDEAA